MATYAWSLDPRNTQKFSTGQMVILNKAWSTYAYLEKEFGTMFPRGVESVADGIIRVKVGKMSVAFATQCISAI